MDNASYMREILEQAATISNHLSYVLHDAATASQLTTLEGIWRQLRDVDDLICQNSSDWMPTESEANNG